MTGLNAVRTGGRVDAATLGAGSVQGAQLLTGGNQSTVTLRREGGQVFAIGNAKPTIKLPPPAGFRTRGTSIVIAQTEDSYVSATSGDTRTITYGSKYKVFGFGVDESDELVFPPGTSTFQGSGPYPRTGTASNSSAFSPLFTALVGDITADFIDIIAPLNNYVITQASAVSPSIVTSGQLIMAHWEVGRDGSVTYNTYTSDSAAPVRLQGIFDFSNPAGKTSNQWVRRPNQSSDPFRNTRRTVLTRVASGGGPIGGASGAAEVNQLQYEIRKNKIPNEDSVGFFANRTAQHMRKSNTQILRGKIPLALDDPLIVFSYATAFISSYQGRER